MLARLKSIVRQVIRPRLHKPEVLLPYLYLGTDYGGWPLLLEHTPASPLIYSFGVGEDVSFDLGAIETFAATVHAFDPTPRSLAWIARQSLPEQFHFHAIGIADVDGEAEFHPPAKAEYVSFSAAPGKGANPAEMVKAPVRRLTSILDDLDTPVPDILKMDVEGFEYGVLDDVIAAGILPGQLLIEFHHRMYDIPTERTLAAVNKLRAAGYVLFFVSEVGHEYAFVHRSVLGSPSDDQ